MSPRVVAAQNAAILIVAALTAYVSGAEAPSSVRTEPGAAAVPSAPLRVRIETIEREIERDLAPGSSLVLEPGASGKGGTVRLGGDIVRLEDALFLQIGAPSSPPRSPILFLRPGGELAGAAAGTDGDTLVWDSPSLGAGLRISLEDAQGWLGPGRSPAAGDPAVSLDGDEARREAALAARLREEILGSKPRKDELVLLEGGRLQGVLDSLDGKSVVFSSDTLGEVRMELARVRALLLAPVGGAEPPDAPPSTAPSAEPSARARVRLRDGGVLPCELLGIRDGRVAFLHPILGRRDVPLAEVAEIELLGGRAVYLSDLEPVRVREEAGLLFRLRMPHRRDASVVGTPLRVGGRTYRKGLGVHSYSLLEYALDGAYQRFRATVGLDDTAIPETGGEGLATVVFRVSLDSKPIFERRLGWKDAPVPLDLPVRGGSRLALEVDYGDREGGFQLALDRADWADARLIR